MLAASKNKSIILICILTMILVGYFSLRPLVYGLRDVNTQVASITFDINQTNDKMATLRTLNEEVQKEQAKIEKLNIAAPKQADLPAILIQLETMATVSQVAITNLAPAKAAAGAPNSPSAESAEIDLAVKGGFTNIISFLEQLEKNIRPLLISQLSFAGAETKEGGIEVTVSLIIQPLLVSVTPAVSPAATAPAAEEPQGPQEAQ